MNVSMVLPPMLMGIPKKPSCAPCAAAAQAIASTIPEAEGGTLKVAGRPTLSGASDDLQTVQAFLQTLTAGVSPTEPALAQAQAAADDLSVTLAVQNAQPPAGVVTMKTFSVALMVIGAVAAGAGVTYLLQNPRRR